MPFILHLFCGLLLLMCNSLSEIVSNATGSSRLKAVGCETQTRLIQCDPHYFFYYNAAF